MDADALFRAALVIRDADERQRLLESECVGRPEVQREVERRLAEYVRDTVDALPTEDRTEAHIPAGQDNTDFTLAGGTVIDGKYILMDIIGEGGMGAVWRARQTEPVKRFVAVKLIKAGMDSKQVLARFEAERQALALMDHLNIAKVYDGGLHEQRPYFVMELVQGIPITEYCDRGRLGPAQRLELFVAVCMAIQHAHQKGIIHRDIKPSNVLVALNDDKPVVKVIDFGVAKATGGALTEITLDTGLSVVGTPEYMSPEQATFNNLDIDTRSDVYSLGVLLYELLAGSPPFTRRELAKKGLMEILRVVREEDPPRPSTKLSTAKTLPSLSASRNMEPKKLTGLLRSELDWIVMKALEKDRTRRYETANGFAADVLRYLAGEPVQAHPPSTAYRLRKFVRRHRGQVLAASLILFTLLAGVVGTTWQWIEARRNAAEVEVQYRNVLTNQEILTKVFRDLDLRKVNQDVTPLPAVLVTRLVDAGTALDATAAKNPLGTAALQHELGTTLLNLGDPDVAQVLTMKAVDVRTKIYGPHAAETLRSLDNLAYCHRERDDVDQAVAIWNDILPYFKTQLGPDDDATLQCQNNLAVGLIDLGKPDDAEPLLRDLLARRTVKHGRHHVDTLNTLVNLASLRVARGQWKDAIAELQQARRLFEQHVGADHPDTLYCLANLAECYKNDGQQVPAMALLKETLQFRKARLGSKHPETLISMFCLAEGYRQEESFTEALALHQETLALRKATLRPDHQHTLQSLLFLGQVCRQSGRYQDAVRHLEDARDAMLRWQQRRGTPYPRLDEVKAHLGGAFLHSQRPRDALPYLIETYALTGTQPQYSAVGDDLMEAYAELGNATEAAAVIQKRVLDYRREYPAGSLELAGVLMRCGRLSLMVRRHADAEELLRESLAIREKQEPGTWVTSFGQLLQVEAYAGLNKFADASPLLRKASGGLAVPDLPKDGHRRVAACLERMLPLFKNAQREDDITLIPELQKKITKPKDE